MIIPDYNLFRNNLANEALDIFEEEYQNEEARPQQGRMY